MLHQTLYDMSGNLQSQGCSKFRTNIIGGRLSVQIYVNAVLAYYKEFQNSKW